MAKGEYLILILFSCLILLLVIGFTVESIKDYLRQKERYKKIEEEIIKKYGSKDEKED